ncbi:uncharacterized protein N7515_008929 [Penicillium bovifimosum]|uniref:Uncharacterized protein n=1 Tax=Penicillium bovifimosum TaxID=126998 RepID=A0A9W9KVC7_9EURO|nr:uncharacterized protein N7515_008929 [Penicillium bovifimosum]KAJ5120968.1 hypothetical protein N7515_008929 [Penicillium bovifimosum]
MKFAFASILPLLAVPITATPFEVRQSNPVTVALSNDQTGAYAGVTFQADGTDRTLRSLFGATSVASEGIVKANAAQLTAFVQPVNCVITNDGASIGTLTAENTYADLDGNPNTAIPFDLSNSKINCRV